MRRLLLVNANTTTAMTDRMADVAAARLKGTWSVVGKTVPFGEPYVASRRAYAIAAHAVVALADDLVARRDIPDAMLIACFGDPGLLAARDILPCPVFGMAEAACSSMIGRQRRYGIITGGAAWGPMLREFLRMMQLDENLASVRTVALTGAEIAADPGRATGILAEAARAAIAEDGAEAILLGGAGLLGQAQALAKAGVGDVTCSLDAALGWIAAHAVEGRS
jgi:allantoin racemase